MFCPNCGHESDENAKFCFKCGNQLPVAQSVAIAPTLSQAQNVEAVAPSIATQPAPSEIQNADEVALYTGFWRRLAAIIVDTLVIIPLYLIVLVLFVIATGIHMPLTEVFKPAGHPATSLVSGLVSWLYFAFMESSAQQATLGKMALGIKVVDLQGNRISFWHATGRHLAKFLSFFSLFIGYIMAGFTRRKQALHDMLASCLVVRNDVIPENLSIKPSRDVPQSGTQMRVEPLKIDATAEREAVHFAEANKQREEPRIRTFDIVEQPSSTLETSSVEKAGEFSTVFIIISLLVLVGVAFYFYPAFKTQTTDPSKEPAYPSMVANEAPQATELTPSQNSLVEGYNLHNQAIQYFNQGQYAQAEEYYKRALKVIGPDHPDVANILQDLGGANHNQGQYAQAEKYYKRAVAKRGKSWGPNHLDVANGLETLALPYVAQGQYAQAEKIHRRVLAIREKLLGPDDPSVALSLNNVANMYYNQYQYAQAVPLYERALAIWEKALGPNHPNVALCSKSLSSAYRALEQAQAEPLAARAASIRVTPVLDP